MTKEPEKVFKKNKDCLFLKKRIFHGERMKNILWFLFLQLLFVPVYADHTKVELSPRIGDELDLYERNYFKLFYNINNFSSAKFYLKKNGNYQVSIKPPDAEKSQDTTFEIKKEIIDQIRFYIENYEFKNAEQNRNFQYNDELWNYIKPSNRYFKNIISWKDINKERYTGTLLYVDSLCFAVLKNTEDFDWRKIEGNIEIIPFNKIFSIENKVILRSFDKYVESLKELRGLCSFQNIYNDLYTYPKELYYLIHKIKNDGKFLINEQQQIKKDYLDDYINLRFGIKLGYPLFLTVKSVNLSTSSILYGYVTKENFILGFPVINYSPFFEINLSQKKHFGGLELNYSPYSLKAGIDLDLSTLGFNIYYMYSKAWLTNTKSDALLLSNIKLNFSLGFSYWFLNVNDKIWDKNNHPDFRGLPYDINDGSHFGIKTGINTNFYILEPLKMNAGFDMLILPYSTRIFNDLSWSSKIGNEYTQKSSNLNLSNMVFYLGLNLDLFNVE